MISTWQYGYKNDSPILGGVILLLFLFFISFLFVLTLEFFYDSMKTVGSNDLPFDYKVQEDKFQCLIFWWPWWSTIMSYAHVWSQTLTLIISQRLLDTHTYSSNMIRIHFKAHNFSSLTKISMSKASNSFDHIGTCTSATIHFVLAKTIFALQLTK